LTAQIPLYLKQKGEERYKPSGGEIPPKNEYECIGFQTAQIAHKKNLIAPLLLDTNLKMTH